MMARKSIHMGRKSCFMSDEAYKKIESYSNATGKSIYDATNEAILTFDRIVSLWGNAISSVLTELGIYKLLKEANALRINLDISPETISLYLHSYIIANNILTPDSVISNLEIVAQFLEGKGTRIPSEEEDEKDRKIIVIFDFRNEDEAEYFRRVCDLLFKNLNMPLRVEKSGTAVRVIGTKE